MFFHHLLPLRMLLVLPLSYIQDPLSKSSRRQFSDHIRYEQTWKAFVTTQKAHFLKMERHRIGARRLLRISTLASVLDQSIHLQYTFSRSIDSSRFHSWCNSSSSDYSRPTTSCRCFSSCSALSWPAYHREGLYK